jgi:TPR repeat protein
MNHKLTYSLGLAFLATASFASSTTTILEPINQPAPLCTPALVSACLKQADRRNIKETCFRLPSELLDETACPNTHDFCRGESQCEKTAPLNLSGCPQALSSFAEQITNSTQPAFRVIFAHMLSWGLGIKQDTTLAATRLHSLATDLYFPAMHELAVLRLAHGKLDPKMQTDAKNLFSFLFFGGYAPEVLYQAKQTLLTADFHKKISDMNMWLKLNLSHYLFVNKLAEEGNAEALYIRGYLRLFRNEIVAFDSLGAIKDFTLASEKGHEAAQFALAVQQYSGQHIPQDMVAALSSFQTLGEEGHVGSIHSLIAHYTTHRELHLAKIWATLSFNQRDDVSLALWLHHLIRVAAPECYINKAIDWLMELAELPDTFIAQTRIGQIFFEGIYRPKNDSLSEMFLRKAATHETELEASYRLAILYIESTEPLFSLELDGDEREVTDAEHDALINKRRKIGKKILADLVDKNYEGAKIHLIHYLIQGKYFDKDLEQAEELLMKCDPDFTPAVYYRGLLNQAKKRPKKAKEYFLKAYKKNGHTGAAYELGVILHQEWLSNHAKDTNAHKATLTAAQDYLNYAAVRGHINAATYLKEIWKTNKAKGS